MLDVHAFQVDSQNEPGPIDAENTQSFIGGAGHSQFTSVMLDVSKGPTMFGGSHHESTSRQADDGNRFEPLQLEIKNLQQQLDNLKTEETSEQAETIRAAIKEKEKALQSLHEAIKTIPATTRERDIMVTDNSQMVTARDTQPSPTIGKNPFLPIQSKNASSAGSKPNLLSMLKQGLKTGDTSSPKKSSVKIVAPKKMDPQRELECLHPYDSLLLSETVTQKQL